MSANNPNVGDVVFQDGRPVGLFLAGASPCRLSTSPARYPSPPSSGRR